MSIFHICKIYLSPLMAEKYQNVMAEKYQNVKDTVNKQHLNWVVTNFITVSIM